MTLRLAVLLSGSGTSLENLFEHIDRGKLDAEIAVVISSKPGAFGLERARGRGVPAVAVSRAKLPEIGAFNDAIHAELAKYDVDLVACLGFLSLFELRGKFEGRTLNVHPALIPAFCGKGFYGHRVHEAVLSAGVKLSGASVHFVTVALDGGPLIVQTRVPILPDDDADTLAARVLETEHRILPRAIRWFAEGRLAIDREGEDEHVMLDGKPAV